MAKQYIHEIGDKLSVGSTADNLPKHIKEIAPVMYNDGSNNFNSIQTALNGKAAGTHSHGNIASGGTLTDTAAAAAGNDYVVIRDADNAKIQTSTIKGTDVADAVSKKHSHSTLTLSTTAQAYDGSHTLALPASDPYTSARTPASHTHGNISNTGTLTDTAAVAAGNDYVVIRDADNAKVQTSTIKGTDVADAVSKKHSHSTLTLSTTAQAYDGSHTLALPSTDPYTSARTPSSHASSATTYGVGTTANYGHVKLATGDMNGATHADGVAVSKNHTHSQYLPKSGGDMTGAITRDLGSGAISDTNLLTVSGSTDGFKVDYGATTSDAGVTKIYTIDDANAKISIGNYNSSYKEAIGITNGSAALSNTPTAPTAAAGTNTTQIATTAFVTDAVSNYINKNELFYLSDWTFSPSRFYIPPLSQLNEGFYCLRKRGYVITTTLTNGSTTTTLDNDAIDYMFDGTYEHFSPSFGDGYTLTINIAPPSGQSSLGIGYGLLGNIVVGFYHVYVPTSVSCRIHAASSASATKTWIDISPLVVPGTGNDIQCWIFGNGYYFNDQLEITIVGKTQSSSIKTSVPVLQFISSRPTANSYPYIRKYSPEFLYNSLTAPKFIGALQGNADTATKLATTRELAVNLANTSTTSNFDGSASQTGIKVSGTLGVGNGGTGKTSVTANSYLKGNGTGALVERTYAEVRSDLGISAGANKVEASTTNGNIKIDGTETTVYTHPTTSGNKHVPSGGSSGQFLGWNSDGTAKWVANPNTDTKVTSSANHYTPATASGSDKTASASGATAAWSIDVVKGVTLNTDGKGHVTGLSVTSGKIPGNPNTDTKVIATAKTDNVNYKILATASASPTSGNATEAVYDADITLNPSTNTIAANISGNAATATKATQDSDGNAINATYFKSSGNVTLVSNTATKIGTQNGADVKLTLPAIPAAVSVKGNAESSYRTGQVNLTPANLGISATTSSVTVGSTTFNKYTHPTTSGNKHIPSGGSSGQFLGWDSDGTAKWVANPNTDTKVTQTKDDSGTTAYPLLMAGATNPNGTATTSRYDSEVTLTPSTNTISANISGNAATSDKSTVSQKYDPAYTGENSINDALDTKLAMTDLSQINLSSTYLASDQRLVFNNMIFGSNIYPIVGNYGLAIFRDDSGNNLDPDATEISGDQDWLLDWRPYLIDMTPVQGETAKTPVKELNRANWLRDVDGNYAPVCCVTPAQKNSLNGEYMCNHLVWGNATKHSTQLVIRTRGCNAYLNDGSYTFNAEGFWEYVKNHWGDINNLARTSYTSGTAVEVYDGTHTYRYSGYSADGTDHIPAPWETTNPNLSVFIGRTKDCYVVDGYSETTGEYIRGLTAKPVEVGSKKFDPEFFRLKRTGISPGPSTTVNDRIRNFFYNFPGGDADTNGHIGTASTGIFYNNGTYPKVNVNQYTTNTYARNCNYNGSSGKAVPVGEGGFHAFNAFLCSIEAAYGTRNLWDSTRFSPGVSSNNTASDDNGGCKIDNTYYNWNYTAVVIQGSTGNLSTQVNGEYPKFQCMEPQIAASLAVEMGIAEGQYFHWNGGSWRYMKPSITGIKSLDHATDKRMNCRIYKLTDAKTVNSKVVRCNLVCALVEGVNPTGDIWWYMGGGCELVYETTGTGNQDYQYSFYLEPDQDKWITGSYVTSSNDEKHTNNTKFDAETTYPAIVTDSTAGSLGNTYTNGRTGYTPLRRVSGNSNNYGECYHQYSIIGDDARGSAGIRSRRRVIFRGRANDGNSSPRCLSASNRPSNTIVSLGCAAQVLLA